METQVAMSINQEKKKKKKKKVEQQTNYLSGLTDYSKYMT